jgi:hypothetical protein
VVAGLKAGWWKVGRRQSRGGEIDNVSPPGQDREHQRENKRSGGSMMRRATCGMRPGSGDRVEPKPLKYRTLGCLLGLFSLRLLSLARNSELALISSRPTDFFSINQFTGATASST